MQEIHRIDVKLKAPWNLGLPFKPLENKNWERLELQLAALMMQSTFLSPYFVKKTLAMNDDPSIPCTFLTILWRF